MSIRARVSLWAAGIAAFVLWTFAAFMSWAEPTAVFVVIGTVQDTAGAPLDGWSVTVSNASRGWELSSETGVDGDPGQFNIVQVDFNTSAAADEGDVIHIMLESPEGDTHEIEETLTSAHITSASLEIEYEVELTPVLELTRIEPASAKQFGGATITLTGAGFVDGATLTVAGVELALAVENETTATVVLPDLTPGTYDAAIQLPDGTTATLAASMTITEALRGDLTGDNRVDISDIVTVARDFGKAGAGLTGDLNGDGRVDITDIVIVARDFGQTIVAAAPALSYVGDVGVTAQGVASLDSDSIAVNVGFDAIPDGLAGYEVEVSFDPTLMRLRSIEEGSVFASGGTFWQATEPVEAEAGRARFIAAALGDASADTTGDLGQLQFELLGNRNAAMRSVRVARVEAANRAAERIRSRVGAVGWDLRLLADSGTFAGNNYPNPFNPETWIPFQLGADSEVFISIYDQSGSPVRALQLGVQPAGGYVAPGKAARWDGRNELGETVASGVYFYEFRAGSYRKVGRMVILK